MRRINPIFTVFGILMAPLAAAASGSHTGELAGGGVPIERSATLRMASANPLVVAGTGFEARERVTVTALTSLRSRILRTRATPGGRFRAWLGTFTQPCGKPFAVGARGARGSVATLLLEAPPCVPPPIR